MNRTGHVRQMASGTLVAGVTAAITVVGFGGSAISLVQAGPAIHPLPTHALKKVQREVPKAPRLVGTARCAPNGRMHTITFFCA